MFSNQNRSLLPQGRSDFLFTIAYAEPAQNKSNKTPETKLTVKNGDWNQFFKENKPSHKIVWKMASRMNTKKQHGELIQFLQAALRNGHSQPWMYEVLAVSMRIKKFPNEEITRVLLSLSDFTPGDVPNLLVSASHLVRFKAYPQALKMYQQASKLAPAQPEPYALGLKLAILLKDTKAIQWAASGILKYDWATGYEKRHRNAHNAFANLIEDVKKSKDTKKITQLESQYIAAKQRDLTLRLEWSGQGDLNMSVEEPKKSVCSTKNKRTAGGGVHVFNGAGPTPKRCFEKYVCRKGFPGEYRIYIKHIAGSIVGKRARLIVIRYQGTDHETKSILHIPLDQREKYCRISLHEGRRGSQSALPKQLNQQRHANNRNRKGRAAMFHEANQNALLNQVGGGGAVVRPGVVGFRPVVTTLSEGATLNAAAVISADRRYVRINVQPIFNTITDVFTFSFAGNGNGNQNPQGGTGIRTP